MMLPPITSLAIFFLHNYLYYGFQLAEAQSFRSPEDYHFGLRIGKDENLYDTGILPDGEDVEIYLFQNEPKSYFFPLEGQASPVSITVIPCSSVVEWKVFYHPHGLDKQVEFEDDPLFLQQSGLQRLTTPPPKTRYLHMFQGRDMTTFVSHGYFPKGILRLTLVAKETHTKVQLYATSTPNSESDFPLLPETPGVDIIANDKASVTVAWKQSPSHIVHGHRINYCVAFNPRQNYRTLCALKADLESEVPPEWPKNAGFGFSWEETQKQRLNNLRRNFHKITKQYKDIHFECVGARHWATVTSLVAGKHYYVSVFAVNEYTNRSVAYLGASFITSGKASLPLLYPGTVQTVHLGGANDQQESFALQLKSYVKKLNLFMQGCSPDVKSDVISHDGAVMAKDVPIRRFQRIVLRHLEAGNYTIRLRSSDDQSHRVKICYTGKVRKCPYHSVPQDLHLNATKNEASCRSVTFRWTSASLHTKYCLYKKKVTQSDENYEAAVLNGDCNLIQSGEQLKSFDRVFCRQYKKSSPQRSGNTITETVWELKTQTDYLFQLQGILKMETIIDYEPVLVSMGNKCT